ncbi:MAG TPA: Mov34/MPN/PAD-1 family protein [Thermodesulfobacteriota bacterium]|nr:Mov34/MPN/PAD-1 family protein [Thermodesulfobacteriota bacterium]
MTTVVLSPQARETIFAHGARDYPNEACGLLLAPRGEPARLVEAHPVANLNTERARDRYTLDPAGLKRVAAAAAAAGLEVAGVYHSHPDHPARPSETDRAQAWGGWIYLVLRVAGGRPEELRAFRLEGALHGSEGGTFVELPLEIGEPARPERRQVPRVAVDLALAPRVHLTLGGPAGTTATLLDLSRLGLRFRTEAPCRPGERLDCRLSVPGTEGPALAFEAEVRWCRPAAHGYECGARIVGRVPEGRLEAIERLLRGPGAARP